MCGIVGYIGPKKVVPVIIEGLRKLEYRGYDSAGIAVVDAAGKLEIRRALSRTHLYSSAFVVDQESGRFVLRGAGWGHGVGLCQIGAAVMANEGNTYTQILQHYYRGTTVSL